MGFIEVQNKRGTSGRNPAGAYDSWLDFWERAKGRRAMICEVTSCGGKPDVGGHVVKAGEGGTEYILPMCHACNSKPADEVFRAWEMDLIPVEPAGKARRACVVEGW